MLLLSLFACPKADHTARIAALQPAQSCFENVATALSDDSYEGRGVGTAGLDRAAEYIAARMRAMGLETSFQPFEATVGIDVGDGNTLADLSYGTDFTAKGFSSSGSFSGEVVFVGYGIRAPELDYDDYAGVDVKDKVLLAMRYEPGEDDENSKFDGRRPSRWSDLRYKALKAREAGAAALIFVSPGDQPDKLPALRTGEPTSNAGLPVLQVTRDVANRWLGGEINELRAAIDADTAPKSKALELTLEGAVDLRPRKAQVRNVIGLLPGSGDLADETVVVGAHYDHLGFGGRGSFRPDEEAIHNGADDNASGVAAVLCGVERFDPTDLKHRRTLVAIAFTAEEIGLGGSSYYVEHPTRPIEQTAAMINLDMVGRVRDGKLQALGTDSATAWEGWLNASKGELELSMGGDGYGPSDQTPFYAAGIPVVHLFSGAHEQYHTPEDDAPLLEIAGGGQVTTLLTGLLTQAATGERPTYVESTTGPTMQGDSRGYGAYLGTIPDYTAMSATEGGVLLSGVRKGGPADTAGIEGGDRIVNMGGVEIRNLYDMTFVLQDHRPGESITVKVKRGEKELELLATLGKRGKKPAGGHHHGQTWTPKAGTDASHLLDPKEVHLTELRQLTDGGENAEAYWAPDGKSLIFQRTPPDGGCDQQFRYDLDSGEVTMVSSGKGRTTCGYYSFPKGDRFIYATTEGGDEACPPVPDRSQGYVWPIYSTFDLVWHTPGGEPEPFLAGPGYDAEATVCFADGRVVFTSTRNGDLDLYVANADGSDLKQLTDTPGYDGGAFFTPDCSKIVWRASRPEGDALADYQRLLKQDMVRPGKLELFEMKSDGSDVRQLTNNGAANFGPYPSPDGGIIFSSNLGGSPREFDLWLLSKEGGDPEQITHTAEFDGFPMFSPDGTWLVFASNRGATDHQTNLFLAKWKP